MGKFIKLLGSCKITNSKKRGLTIVMKKKVKDAIVMKPKVRNVFYDSGRFGSQILTDELENWRHMFPDTLNLPF